MNREIIRNSINGFIEKMGLSADSIDISEKEDNADFSCLIRTKDSSLLIGKEGRNFSAIHHLLKRVISKQLANQDLKISIDINDYKKEQIEKIKMKTKILAERAKSMNTEVEMEPMDSYQRMIVHSFFSDSLEFETFSKGVGVERRVVIKYLKPI